MPTVSAPISSRAISAMIGAAPVPVPPPSPAVTNTMSASASASRISARLSSAAWQPTSGFAPAPRPRVSSSPMWIVLSASDMSRACRSVFTAMNSTPRTPASTMRFTAFVPPPPTPTTLMTAKCSEPILFGIVSSTPAAFSNAAFPVRAQFTCGYCTRCSTICKLRCGNEMRTSTDIADEPGKRKRWMPPWRAGAAIDVAAHGRQATAGERARPFANPRGAARKAAAGRTCRRGYIV